jgi:hypothetical protein
VELLCVCVCVFESFFVVETWDFIVTQVKTVLNNLLEFWFHFWARSWRKLYSAVLVSGFSTSCWCCCAASVEVWSVECRAKIHPRQHKPRTETKHKTQKHERKYIVMNSHRQLHAPEDLVVTLRSCWIWGLKFFERASEKERETRARARTQTVGRLLAGGDKLLWKELAAAGVGACRPA